ncbi:hypothetical protein DAETH_24380 [Deinococcus aetherius]|uniref:Uncharacterized protein n=1 Tax=Deinococcus aetherius TaxID=200252 RepID=A0ABM8AFB1_9DEIO|nr:hypothetical protein [Deinococcus aetherius]BDP42469.1 hypothetical protein DAETH_24380 [Deinococcus aetherius]
MLAFVICEALDGKVWQAEARFLVRSARDLRALLDSAGLGDRGHQPDVSVTVRGDLLMEDRRVSGRTVLTTEEVARLAAVAEPNERAQLTAWHAFARTLEDAGRPARLIFWFVG